MGAWDRLPDEPGEAWAAFVIYRDLGPGRGIDAAYRSHKGREPRGPQKGARAPGCWRRWAEQYAWRDRATAFDANADAVRQAATRGAVEQQAIKQVVDEWQGRREQLRQREWALREKLIEKAEAMLAFPLATVKDHDSASGITRIFTPAKWEFKDAVSLLRLARDLGRGAARMPLDVEPEPVANVGDQLFESEAALADAIPEGAVPGMPEEPGAKPDLGSSVQVRQVTLQQPLKRARP